INDGHGFSPPGGVGRPCEKKSSRVTNMGVPSVVITVSAVPLPAICPTKFFATICAVWNVPPDNRIDAERPLATAASMAHCRLLVSSAPVGRSWMTSRFRETDEPQLANCKSELVELMELAELDESVCPEPQAMNSAAVATRN